jgi:hypothetical protein
LKGLDLAPTLESELGQISTDNVVTEINNLNGSLKNLDKNITQRVVQFADQTSGDLADAAVKGAKSLLGFDTATKEATDSLINLSKAQGDLGIVQTNRAQLAMEIQSIRMNEADPIAQEAQIKAAMEGQAMAESQAQFQVNEAQKAADKVAYDESVAGKFQNAAGEMVGGIAKDVIKGELLGLFTNATDGTASKPYVVHVNNFPDSFGINAEKLAENMVQGL